MATRIIIEIVCDSCAEMLILAEDSVVEEGMKDWGWRIVKGKREERHYCKECVGEY